MGRLSDFIKNRLIDFFVIIMNEVHDFSGVLNNYEDIANVLTLYHTNSVPPTSYKEAPSASRMEKNVYLLSLMTISNPVEALP